MQIFRKYKIPLITLLIFALVGIILWVFRDIRYFILFISIGLLDSSTRIIIGKYPKLRQLSRRLLQLFLA